MKNKSLASARLLFLCCAFHTTAALPNEVVEVLFAVVVGQLFARLNGLPRHDKHAIAADDHFAVRPTGVVDVARNILTGGSVDGAAIIEVEKILPTNPVSFIVSNHSAEIFHHKPTAGNRLLCHQSKTRGSFANRNVEWRLMRLKLFHKQPNRIAENGGKVHRV